MIYAVLNYPNLVTYIDHATAIDYYLLVLNVTFKINVKKKTKKKKKKKKKKNGNSKLLSINFGMCEIYVIMNYP